MRLAAPVAGRMDVTREGLPVLEALAAEVGETVNLAVLRGTDVVNLEQVRGPATITTVNWVGQPTPLHATASGKVLLAAFAPDDLAAFLARPLPRITPRTIAEAPALERELARVREQGYATTTEELEQGLDAVAAPVRDSGGRVVAAISVSGPVYRFDAARMAEVAPAVVAAAADLSRRLGYASPSARTGRPRRADRASSGGTRRCGAPPAPARRRGRRSATTCAAGSSRTPRSPAG